jgi:hypothetical protein
VKVIRNYAAQSIALLLLNGAVFAAPQASTDNPPESISKKCLAQSGDDKQKFKQCLEQRFEIITVIGKRALPVSIGLTGKYVLDRDFISDSAKGNGNITDMLSNLPGVQTSESALNVSQQAEIRSQLISVSGAEPWQTGFFFDGASNNSLLDPDASNLSVAAINDVQGHPQSFFINQALVGEVTLYESNVPAKFGQFSGGVVDVKPRSYFQSPIFRLNYRTSRSEFNKYTLIDERNYNDANDGSQDESNIELPRAPSFAKETLSLMGKVTPFENHELIMSLSRTTSLIDQISLQKLIETERESISSSIQYQIKNILFDEIRFHASYSPYTGQHIITDVLNSELTNEGGGASFVVNTKEAFESFDWRSRFSYSFSENSRSAPNIYRPWYRAAGKSWGIDVNDVPFSIEGGYGNIEKNQNIIRFDNDFNLDPMSFLRGNLLLDLGVSLEQAELSRNRTQTGLIYNSPFRDANLNCREQLVDCIEQSYVTALAIFVQQFGGQIDFSDPVQIAAYRDNLLTRGQFFRYRRVYPVEDIDVSKQLIAVYSDGRLEYERVRINLGARIEYDSIFENINISPRFSIGFDPFADNDYLLSLGFNRYYASGPLTYLIREQQRPYLTQYRALSKGDVGDWLVSTQAQRFSYDYNDLATPYNDEISLGWQQSAFGGIFSLKTVHRKQKDQVTRGETKLVDGITIISQDNLGYGEYERYTASYNIAFKNHAVWFHVSHTDNKSSASSYDESVQNIPEDELVILRAGNAQSNISRLISQQDLSLRNLDYSRPINANLSVQSDWSEHFSTNLNISYVGNYDAAVYTGLLQEIDRDIRICGKCEIDSFLYPLYIEVQRPAITLLNLATQYNLALGKHNVGIGLEINNLLDARTFSVTSGQTGLEVGRSFWLEVSYEL